MLSRPLAISFFFLYISKTTCRSHPFLTNWHVFAPFLSFISLFLASILSHLHYLTFPSHTPPYNTFTLFSSIFFLCSGASLSRMYLEPIIYLVNHSCLPSFLAQSDVLFWFFSQCSITCEIWAFLGMLHKHCVSADSWLTDPDLCYEVMWFEPHGIKFLDMVETPSHRYPSLQAVQFLSKLTLVTATRNKMNWFKRNIPHPFFLEISKNNLAVRPCEKWSVNGCIFGVTAWTIDASPFYL